MNLALIYFLIFILGACVGSFLNVVAYRYGTRRSAIFDRSRCLSCQKKLNWFELIPLLSFIIQKGKCRKCKAKISWQYMVVEILTGLVFLLIFNSQLSIFNQFSTALILSIFYLWLIFSILIVIAVYDYHHKIIPDALVFSFIGLSFFSFLIIHNSEFIIHLIAGPAIASPFFLIWLISGGRWMGFGDVKLAFGMGYFLGISDGLYALLWSFWIGGVFSIFLITISSLSSNSKRFTMKSEVPFGPFMILGTAVAFFLEWNFLNLYFFQLFQ